MISSDKKIISFVVVGIVCFLLCVIISIIQLNINFLREDVFVIIEYLFVLGFYIFTIVARILDNKKWRNKK